MPGVSEQSEVAVSIDEEDDCLASKRELVEEEVEKCSNGESPSVPMGTEA